MEIISYIMFWELMCVGMSFAGTWNILKSRRKTGFFLLISGVALPGSMFIVLFPYISVIIFYPLAVLLVITSVLTMLLFKRKKT